jgi:predicted TIM-barrel fold metal-dependent hydrolase
MAGVLTRELIGVENLLWGNDYPHHDAIWPHSMETLDKVFQSVPQGEREKMCWSNTIDLYGIDDSKLPAAV